MFSPEQVGAALAFNACVDPNSTLGKYLQLTVQIQVKGDELKLTPEEQKLSLPKMQEIFVEKIKKAVFSDGVVTTQERKLLDFMEQLKTDKKLENSLKNDIATLTDK